MLILARSILFNILFYLNLLVYFIAAIPSFFLPYRVVVAFAKAWGRTNLWLVRAVCGIDVEWIGLEKIPKGPLIVASKHQSLWETFGLLTLFRDPTFIVKRELMWIPFFGWYIWKARMIPVNRGARTLALADMTARARVELQRDRQLIIFPEGTRRAPGAEPAYKFGVAHLYAETGVPCLPVALNSGLVWPRRKFLRYPGTVRVEILDPIPPGLGRAEFFERLKTDIETATARLVATGTNK
ncbi:MAG TPA: lysophospholipid acyltransferase family protein [Xanthobacteraceae bacterium]|nr:lysophospholipid acyltransferase family protein [Xanthobacteraceae bacterium]